MLEREIIIKSYLDAYNHFDVEKMVADFGDAIVFENIQNDKLTMTLNGRVAFKQQAEQAKTYFTERNQTIRTLKHFDSSTEVEIDYCAVLAIDLPNGLKKGEKLKLTGKSIFVFENGKISKLTDIN